MRAASLLTSDPRVRGRQLCRFASPPSRNISLPTASARRLKRVLQAFGAAKITQSSCRMQTGRLRQRHWAGIWFRGRTLYGAAGNCSIGRGGRQRTV